MKIRISALSGSVALAAMVALGVFASNGWLPKTDPFTGKKTGWFGKKLPKHHTSAWNPFPPAEHQRRTRVERRHGERLVGVQRRVPGGVHERRRP
jgi:hypothetical protein